MEIFLTGALQSDSYSPICFPSRATCGSSSFPEMLDVELNYQAALPRKPRDGDRLTGYNEARGHLIYSGSQSQILRGLIITVKASRS